MTDRTITFNKKQTTLDDFKIIKKIGDGAYS